MKLPSFEAEASLAKASRHYNHALIGVATAGIGVLPGSILPSQLEGLDETASVDDGDEMGEDVDDEMEDEA
jgi:hypothetical protein